MSWSEGMERVVLVCGMRGGWSVRMGCVGLLVRAWRGCLLSDGKHEDDGWVALF